MKNFPAFLLACIPLSSCVTASRMDSKTDKPSNIAGQKNESIVLLPGQGRTRLSMLVLSMRFRSAGYKTANFTYNQKSDSLDEISEQLVEFIGKKVKTSNYHLIGHSLGNVIIRNAFRKEYPSGLGKVVMLAPPNQPAHLATHFKKNLLYRWLAGDSGQKLSEGIFYRDLPVPTVPFGILAGDKGQSLTFSEPNDGLVAVKSTELEGMNDWLLLHHSHTFIMNCKDTFEHCLSFIESGRFKRVEPE
jgi:triacylglycerol lipase|tara:strand:- start:85 stop:822 length:738 start_codon:yes stop_codon:yes gene_type:complete